MNQMHRGKGGSLLRAASRTCFYVLVHGTMPKGHDGPRVDQRWLYKPNLLFMRLPESYSLTVKQHIEQCGKVCHVIVLEGKKTQNHTITCHSYSLC